MAVKPIANGPVRATGLAAFKLGRARQRRKTQQDNVTLDLAQRSGYHPRNSAALPPGAALAQLVEHIIRNDGVTCSSHVSGTTLFQHMICNSLAL